MLTDRTTSETFSTFVEEHEVRLRHALTARFGSDVRHSSDVPVAEFRHDEAVPVGTAEIGVPYRRSFTRMG